MEWSEIAATAAVVLPIVLAIVRWIWQLGSVQNIVKKSYHADSITEAVEKGIYYAEQVSTASANHGGEKLTGGAKKKMAMDFARSTALKLGVPTSMLDDETVSGYVEAALGQVRW